MGCGCGPRLMIGLVIAAVSLISYFSMRSTNPFTGETQYVALSVPQEIQLGLQAAPEMANQMGGLSQDADARARVERVGRRLVERTKVRESEYKFDFHLLGDAKTINAFALPGGQVFITEGLYRKFETEGQLAGVLGHEIGHVVGRHGAEHMAKQGLTQGLIAATAVATSDERGVSAGGAIAAFVGQMVNLRYGRDDEYESDRLGVAIASDAGYDPRAMIGVMRILAEASKGGAPPELFSTHPNPENRVGRLEELIREKFPQGVPEGLEP